MSLVGQNALHRKNADVVPAFRWEKYKVRAECADAGNIFNQLQANQRQDGASQFPGRRVAEIS